MIQSMTGYGKATGTYKDKKITIEVKSLNSKYFDLNLRLPSFYRENELTLNKMLSKLIVRGKVDFSIYVELPPKSNSTKINHEVVTTYFNDLKSLSDSLGVKDDSKLMEMAMKMPEVYSQEREELDEDEWKAVELMIQEAIVNFEDFRKREGQILHNEFSGYITRIAELMQEVEQYEGERIETVKARLKSNLEEKLDNPQIDNNRFEQELIYFIEKYDVTEEKVRLKGHLDYFLEVIKSEQSEGKKLGFISQEIGREVNTLGSKANHQEIQKIVVEMKDLLEKIKEQVLNTL
ncbi:MAG: hypothetical protein ACI8RY_000352 [Urechidicola sp.]|jgi:uncharacterized protein (TIGR00255 family)|tara:strand:+ start:2586 stop:3461 length:876 start_codon:yes stop_codon:yes gene_type:complete